MVADERGDAVDLQRQMVRVGTLVDELDQLPDPTARANVEEVIRLILELHEAGLRRMLELLEDAGAPAEPVLAGYAGDELVSSVLMLHGLHPSDLRSRVEGALDSVRPYMRSHAGGVELLGIEGDVVRLRLEGSCDGCPSSAMTLKLAVEKAILEAAPDVAAIEVEGLVEPVRAPAGPPNLSQITRLPMVGPVPARIDGGVGPALG